MTTRIPIVTFGTGYGSTAVAIDSELFHAASAALDRAHAEEERERQARLAEEATKPKPAAAPSRRLIALVGQRASGFFT